MNTTKHTAGPWTSGQVGNGQVFDIIGADVTGRGREIVGSFRASQNRDANEANARLIAAAPELLAALEIINALAKNGIITRHETGKPTWCLVNELSKITNAALARATGKAEQLAEYDTAKKRL